MMTIRHLITHSLVTMYKNDKANTNSQKVYGHVDLFLGPGDSIAFLAIPILYDSTLKQQYFQWTGEGATLSKQLFERDLSPKCHESLVKIKEKFGKLEYDTIYLVNEFNVEKVSPQLAS
jgi:hypothetical protein